MKTTTTLLKISLVGLLLTLTTSLLVQAQQTPPGPIVSLGPGDNSLVGSTARGALFDPGIASFDDELVNSILFFNPNTANGFTLRASTIEDHEDDRGLTFTNYIWTYSTNGTDYDPVGTDAAALVQSGLAPGYHHYKVEARIVPVGTDPDLTCDADNEETFVVFVLPPLTVTITNTAAGDLLQYCESDADEPGGQTNITLSAAVDYASYTGEPDPATEFGFNYRWYYVKSNGTELFSQDHNDFVEITMSDITDATEITGETLGTYTPGISDIGTYKFFVEVEYQIKDRSHGLGADDPEERNRPHVIYRGWFGGLDQATASIVTVTPQPGKPHITIEEVID